jgi:hypothetical protein
MQTWCASLLAYCTQQAFPSSLPTAPLHLGLASGVPLVYQFDAAFKPIRSPAAIGPLSGRYVGDQDAIRAEIEKVANQSKKK